MDAQRNNNVFIGWVCLGMGITLLLLWWFEIGDNVQPDTPGWILPLCGLILIISSAMAFVGRASNVNNLFAALFFVMMSAIGFWIAIWSSGERISGGLPFLSTETNALIGRWVFGIGAVICLALAVYAINLFRSNIVKKNRQS